MKNLSGLVRAAAVAVALLMGAGSASAYTITFEDIPGSTPSDGMSINTQFWTSYGVSFHLFDVNTWSLLPGSPVLAQVGAPRTAFAGYDPILGADQLGDGVNNTVNDQGVDNWFLTDDGSVFNPPIALLINYAFPVTEASGQILDIDASESWRVRAFSGINGGGTTLDDVTLTTSSTNAGDGQVTPFGFSGLPGIQSILINYAGGPGNIGFAFDNFSPPTLESYFCATCAPPTDFVPAPEPVTMTTSLVGMGYLAYRRRRQAQGK